jgi:hypothetical protein
MVLRILASSLVLFILAETEGFTMFSSSLSQIKKGGQPHLKIVVSSRKMYLQRGLNLVTRDQRNVALRCSENDFEDYGYDEKSVNRTDFVPPKLRGLRPRGIRFVIFDLTIEKS